MSRFFTKKESTLLPPPEPIEAEDIKLWDILKHLEYPKTAEGSYSYSLWLLPNPSLHPILRACALFDAGTGYLFEKRYELAVIYTFELSRLFDEVPLETYEGFPLKHQWEVRGKVRRMKEKLPLVWFDLMSGGLFSGKTLKVNPTVFGVSELEGLRVNGCVIYRVECPRKTVSVKGENQEEGRSKVAKKEAQRKCDETFRIMMKEVKAAEAMGYRLGLPRPGEQES